jgi:hypothetical protein
MVAQPTNAPMVTQTGNPPPVHGPPAHSAANNQLYQTLPDPEP